MYICRVHWFLHFVRYRNPIWAQHTHGWLAHNPIAGVNTSIPHWVHRAAGNKIAISHEGDAFINKYEIFSRSFLVFVFFLPHNFQLKISFEINISFQLDCVCLLDGLSRWFNFLSHSLHSVDSLTLWSCRLRASAKSSVRNGWTHTIAILWIRFVECEEVASGGGEREKEDGDCRRFRAEFKFSIVCFGLETLSTCVYYILISVRHYVHIYCKYVTNCNWFRIWLRCLTSLITKTICTMFVGFVCVCVKWTNFTSYLTLVAFAFCWSYKIFNIHLFMYVDLWISVLHMCYPHAHWTRRNFNFATQWSTE